MSIASAALLHPLHFAAAFRSDPATYGEVILRHVNTLLELNELKYRASFVRSGNMLDFWLTADGHKRTAVFDINTLRVHQGDLRTYFWDMAIEMITGVPTTVTAPIAMPTYQAKVDPAALTRYIAARQINRRTSPDFYRMCESRCEDIKPVLDCQEELTVSVSGHGAAYIIEFTCWRAESLPIVNAFKGWSRLLHEPGEHYLIIQNWTMSLV